MRSSSSSSRKQLYCKETKNECASLLASLFSSALLCVGLSRCLFQRCPRGTCWCSCDVISSIISLRRVRSTAATQFDEVKAPSVHERLQLRDPLSRTNPGYAFHTPFSAALGTPRLSSLMQCADSQGYQSLLLESLFSLILIPGPELAFVLR